MTSTELVVDENCPGSGWAVLAVVDDLYELTMCAQRSCSKMVDEAAVVLWQLVDLC